MAQCVQGKTAIVTGAGSGINFCFVKLLLENGCNCILADIALQPSAKALVEQYSASIPRAVFQQTDVTDWAQLERAFDAAEKEFGGIDIVCPGAGVFEPSLSSFWHPPGSPESRDSPSGSRYTQVDINLIHPIRTTQLAVSRFANAKTPKTIIHISSIAGQVSSFVTPVYAATKHAINGFVRSMSKLSETGIRVAAVAPGYVKTPLWTENPDKMKLVHESNDVWVTPEEVATVMLALVQQDEVSTSILMPEEEGALIPVGNGTILEVGKFVRKVSTFNDPGPLGRPGNSMADPRATEEELFALLQSGNWGKIIAN